MVCDNTWVKFSPKPLAQPSNIGVANHKLLDVFNSYLEVHLKSLCQMWLNLISMSKPWFSGSSADFQQEKEILKVADFYEGWENFK